MSIRIRAMERAGYFLATPERGCTFIVQNLESFLVEQALLDNNVTGF